MPLDQETGYLEQGYVNVATAPLDMQLDAIRMRKTALGQAQSNLRHSNYKENKRKEDNDTFERFSDFVEGLPDSKGSEWNDSVSGYFKQNPDAAQNAAVQRVVTATTTSDENTYKFRDSERKENNRNAEQKVLSLELKAREQIAQDQVNRVDSELRILNETMAEQRRLEEEAENNEHNDKLVIMSANLWNGLSLHNSDTRAAAVGIYSALSTSTNQIDNETAQSMSTMVRNLQGQELISKIAETHLERMAPYIRSFKQKYPKVDLRGLTDPKTREVTINAMSKEMISEGITEKEKQAFKAFARTAGVSARMRADNEKIIVRFHETIALIKDLEDKPDAASQRKLAEVMANLSAESVAFAGYIKSGRKDIKALKDANTKLEQEERDEAKKRSDDLAAKTAKLNYEKIILIRDGFADKENKKAYLAASEKALKHYGDKSSTGFIAVLGLNPKTATIDQFRDAIIEFKIPESPTSGNGGGSVFKPLNAN